MFRKSNLAACAAVAGMLLASGPAALASSPSTPKLLADNLVSPLHLAIGHEGTVLVTQQFAGLISKINDDGSVSTVYDSQGWNVAGLHISESSLYFVESLGAGPDDPRDLAGRLKVIENVASTEPGPVREIADLATIETTTNPDSVNHYGFGPDVPAECLAQLPAMIPGSYTGEVDSHPYALTVSEHKAYVADAGSNTILKVNKTTGAVSTLAVLPPQPVVISAEVANSFGAPSCAGHSYAFEPVPTDIEVGPDGWLYVSLLPGGPEDPSLGARGSIVRVNPETGDVQTWAEGILSPTGLAIARNGDVYVASLFGEGIFRFDAKTQDRSLFLPTSMAADVEIKRSTLYATVDAISFDPAAPPAGKVISVPLKGEHDDDDD